MKLVYWYAECLDDHPCYSIRTKTKKECIAKLTDHDAESYGKPRKIILEYKNGFDLLTQCLGEGGLWEEG